MVLQMINRQSHYQFDRAFIHELGSAGGQFTLRFPVLLQRIPAFRQLLAVRARVLLKDAGRITAVCLDALTIEVSS